MPGVDFMLSNDRHHAQMFEPGAKELGGRGVACRVISLCEFRGLLPPVDTFARMAVRVLPVVPMRVRPSTAVGRPGSLRPRKALQVLSPAGTLAPHPRKLLTQRPDVVVLSNDAATSYDRLSRWLRVRHGVRKAIPARLIIAMYKIGLAKAAARHEVFHLWFHPSNLGSEADRQFAVLDAVLRYAAHLRVSGVIRISPMEKVLGGA